MKLSFPAKVVVGFSIGSFGDMTGQILQRRKSEDPNHPLNFKRTFLWGSAVACLQVPMFHLWFGFIDSRIPGKGVVAGLKKTMLEGTTIGPLYLLLVNLWATFVMKGGFQEERPLQVARANIEQSFVPSVMTAWCTVSPVQFLSHSFLPPQYKLIFLNVVSMIYNVLLSQIVNPKKIEADASTA